MGIVAAFASDVELFVLDEPTSGLDPLMSSVFQECVMEVKRNGKTALMSSHILADVEKLCHRVSFIRKGRIVETGSLDGMRHMRRNITTVTTDAPDKKEFELLVRLSRFVVAQIYSGFEKAPYNGEREMIRVLKKAANKPDARDGL